MKYVLALFLFSSSIALANPCEEELEKHTYYQNKKFEWAKKYSYCLGKKSEGKDVTCSKEKYWYNYHKDHAENWNSTLKSCYQNSCYLGDI